LLRTQKSDGKYVFDFIEPLPDTSNIDRIGNAQRETFAYLSGMITRFQEYHYAKLARLPNCEQLVNQLWNDRDAEFSNENDGQDKRIFTVTIFKHR